MADDAVPPDGVDGDAPPVDYVPADPHETIEERRLRLVQDHDLLDDTGDWGEVVDLDLDTQTADVRNPEFTSEVVKLGRAEKQVLAIRMKAAGASYRHIGETLGYSSNHARNLVKQGLQESLQESAEELRRIHYNRLETMLGVHWERMLKGDPVAFDKSMAAMDRIERLYGLAAPNRSEHTHVSKEALVIADGDREAYLDVLKQAARLREADELLAEQDVVDAEVVDD